VLLDKAATTKMTPNMTFRPKEKVKNRQKRRIQNPMKITDKQIKKSNKIKSALIWHQSWTETDVF
jgi:hypothetical protein